MIVLAANRPRIVDALASLVREVAEPAQHGAEPRSLLSQHNRGESALGSGPSPLT
jgi:hypothetical protein